MLLVGFFSFGSSFYTNSFASIKNMFWMVIILRILQTILASDL